MDNLTDILKVLKAKEWVDLTHNVNPDIPRFGQFEPIQEKTLYTIQKDGFYAKQYTLVSQYGTHIDAPIHFDVDSTRDVSSISLKEMMSPLYVLHLQDEVEKNHDFSVSIQDILDFEEKHGRIEEHAFVAFCSNWSKRWDDPESFYNFDKQGLAHTPGWSLDAVKFLINERNVAAIGHESLDTDSAKDCREAGYLYAEQAILLADRYQIEVMTNLDKVPPVGAIIINSVPKIDNATGFPVRSYAILPDDK